MVNTIKDIIGNNFMSKQDRKAKKLRYKNIELQKNILKTNQVLFSDRTAKKEYLKHIENDKSFQKELDMMRKIYFKKKKLI